MQQRHTRDTGEAQEEELCSVTVAGPRAEVPAGAREQCWRSGSVLGGTGLLHYNCFNTRISLVLSLSLKPMDLHCDLCIL
jgi:hypothetical protein